MSVETVRKVRVSDFIAEGVEKIAAKMPLSYKEQADAYRKMAVLIRQQESRWIIVREISGSEVEQDRNEAEQEFIEDLEYRAATAISPELDEIDNR